MSWDDHLAHVLAGTAQRIPTRAEWFRRTPDRSYEFLQETELPHDWAPDEFLVTERGYLVTLGDFMQSYDGLAITSHGPNGALIAEYRLDQLFSEELAEFHVEFGHLVWRGYPPHYFEELKTLVVDVRGEDRKLYFEPENGSWQICEPRDGETLCRSSNDDRVWRPMRGPSEEPR